MNNEGFLEMPARMDVADPCFAGLRVQNISPPTWGNGSHTRILWMDEILRHFGTMVENHSISWYLRRGNESQTRVSEFGGAFYGFATIHRRTPQIERVGRLHQQDATTQNRDNRASKARGSVKHVAE